ncbi:hypothetical protein [Streptomyces sp. NPDC048641]|uniref:hypothetical protein n=1 Tax=Streptomyces sp. NPDC048641 TaxID=3154825 RepID=UPI0034409165
MALHGRPTYAVDQPITTPALVISLGDDTLSPVGAVDDLAHRLFSCTSVARWHHTRDQVSQGSANDHIGWVHPGRGGRPHPWWHDAARSWAVVGTCTIHLKETPCRPFSAPAGRSPTSS